MKSVNLSISQGLEGEGGDLKDDDDKGVDPIIIYETDEEEFLDKRDSSQAEATDGPDTEQRGGPEKSRNTAKQQRSARKMDKIGYDLAYFNLWWSRMAIEGRKEANETIRKKEEEVLTKRKLVKVRRRMTRVVDDVTVSTGGCQNYNALRGGNSFSRGNEKEGVGRGSPVPNDWMINEQPLIKKTLILDTVAEEGRNNLKSFESLPLCIFHVYFSHQKWI